MKFEDAGSLIAIVRLTARDAGERRVGGDLAPAVEFARQREAGEQKGEFCFHVHKISGYLEICRAR